MANYSIKDGKKVVYSKYSKTGVLRLTKVFPDDKDTTNKLIQKKKNRPNKGSLSSIYGNRSNADLVRKIYSTFLLKVLDRVVEGDMFVLPGKTSANIVMKQATPEQLNKIRAAGAYTNLDTIASMGIVPRVCFDFGPKSPRKDFGIYMPKELNDKMLHMVETETLPWMYIPKNKDYDLQIG